MRRRSEVIPETTGRITPRGLADISQTVEDTLTDSCRDNPCESADAQRTPRQR